MAVSREFKEFVVKVRNVLDENGVDAGTYSLLNIADALFVEPSAPNFSTHEGRVTAALNSHVVLDYLRAGKKINAIKELRTITLCGLKEAKDAVEDNRVDAYYVRSY